MKINLFILLGLLIWSQAYAAKSHLYRLYDIGNSIGKTDCELKANELAQKIATLASVNVKGSLCEYSTTIETKNLLISYEADEPLEIVSTYTFGDTYVDKGTYKTEQECLQNIAQDEKVFTEVTGLTPFVSFCSTSKFSRVNPWFSYIEAFGNSEIQPRRAHWKSGTPYGFTKSQFFTEVKNQLETYGVQLEHLNFARAVFGVETSLFYYTNIATPKLYFGSKNISHVSGLSQCMGKAEMLKNEILTKGTFPLVTSYCTSTYSNPKSFDLELISLGFNYLNVSPTEKVFSSDEECELSRPSIQNKYELVHGDKVIGSTCERKQTGSSASYKVIIVKTL
jgi:hypothetical protein